MLNYVNKYMYMYMYVPLHADWMYNDHACQWKLMVHEDGLQYIATKELVIWSRGFVIGSWNTKSRTTVCAIHGSSDVHLWIVYDCCSWLVHYDLPRQVREWWYLTIRDRFATRSTCHHRFVNSGLRTSLFTTGLWLSYDYELPCYSRQVHVNYS